jgi:hypothetical protein
MGAQQTYERAVRFPDMVKRAAPIAGTARPIQTIDGHLAVFGVDANALSQLDQNLKDLLAAKV